MQVIKEFYTERVNAGDRETAELALTIRSMMDDMEQTRAVPTWFQPAGFVVGVLTLLFLMALVVAAIFGHQVPHESRFLIELVFSLGCALSAAFFGGEAAASGKIPFFGNAHPLMVSATGGIAVLVIVLAISHSFYG
jgi:hypothetical protein